MNALHALTDQTIQRIAWSLVHFLWQGTAIAVLLACTLRLVRLRRPAARYAIYLVGLVAMTVCPIVTPFCIRPMIDSVFKENSSHCRMIEPSDQDAITVTDFLHNGGAVQNHAPRANSDSITDDSTTESAAVDKPFDELRRPKDEAADLEDLGEAQPRDSRFFKSLWPALSPWIVFGWLFGVAMLSLRLILGWIGLRRLRRRIDQVPKWILIGLHDLADSLRMPPPLICLSHRVSEAVAVGFLKPMILLPVAWATEVPPDMVEAVILHELAHIRRHDLWVNLFQRLMETLLFYHPAVWWLSCRLRIERELCCDEIVVHSLRNPIRYAETLELIGRLSLDKSRTYAHERTTLTVSICSPRRVLLSRIRAILNPDAREQTPADWIAGFIPLIFFCLIAGTVLGRNAAPANDDADKRPVIEVAAANNVAEEPLQSSPPSVEWGPESHGLQCRLIAVSQNPDLTKSTNRFDRAADLTFAVELKNVSDKPLNLLGIQRELEGDLGSVENIGPEFFTPHYFEFEFTTTDGRRLPRPKRDFAEIDFRLALGSIHSIAPGESLRLLLRPARFVLPMEYDLPLGNYRVKVTYRGPDERIKELFQEAARLRISTSDRTIFLSEKSPGIPHVIAPPLLIPMRNSPEYHKKVEREAGPDGKVRSVVKPSVRESRAAVCAEAWSNEVTSNEVAFSVGIGKSTIQPAKLVWGETSQGLQAAVEIRATDNEATNRPPGTFPRQPNFATIFHIKNVSEHSICFLSEAERKLDYAIATRDDGVKIVFERPSKIHHVPIVRWTLQPGEVAQLRAANNGGHQLDKPGNYSIEYRINLGNLVMSRNLKNKYVMESEAVVGTKAHFIKEDLFDRNKHILVPGAVPITIVDGPPKNEPIDANGEIRGRLADAVTGKPVEGATISCRAILNDSKNDDVFPAVTNSEGAYRLPVPSPGIYNVWLKKYDKDDSLTAVTDDGILVEAGKIAESQLRLVPVRTISGRVVTFDGGKPVEDVEIKCHSSSLPSNRNSQKQWTKADGSFTFVVPPGHAVLTVNQFDQHVGESVEGLSRFVTAQLDVPASGEIAPLTLVVGNVKSKLGDDNWLIRSTRGSQIVRRTDNPAVAGQVVDAQGNSIVGAKVFRIAGPFTMTDENGEFSYKVLKNKQCQLYVVAPGYHVWLGTPTSGDVLKVVLESKQLNGAKAVSSPPRRSAENKQAALPATEASAEFGEGSRRETRDNQANTSLSDDDLFIVVPKGKARCIECASQILRVDGFNDCTIGVNSIDERTLRLEGLAPGFTFLNMIDEDQNEFGLVIEVTDSQSPNGVTTDLPPYKPKPRKPLKFLQFDNKIDHANCDFVILQRFEKKILLEFPEKIARIDGFDEKVIHVDALTENRISVQGLSAGKTTLDVNSGQFRVGIEVKTQEVTREMIRELIASEAKKTLINSDKNESETTNDILAPPSSLTPLPEPKEPLPQILGAIADEDLFVVAPINKTRLLQFDNRLRCIDEFDERIVSVTAVSETRVHLEGRKPGFTLLVVKDVDGNEFSMVVEVPNLGSSTVVELTPYRPMPRENPWKSVTIIRRDREVIKMSQQPKILEFENRILRVDGFDQDIVSVKAQTEKLLQLNAVKEGSTKVIITDETHTEFIVEVIVSELQSASLKEIPIVEGTDSLPEESLQNPIQIHSTGPKTIAFDGYSKSTEFSEARTKITCVPPEIIHIDSKSHQHQMRIKNHESATTIIIFTDGKSSFNVRAKKIELTKAGIRNLFEGDGRSIDALRVDAPQHNRDE